MLHIIFLFPQIHMFSGSKGSHHFSGPHCFTPSFTDFFQPLLHIIF